jgi:hypothetical protein
MFYFKGVTLASDSLFTYPMGKTHASYQNPSFVPVFEPPAPDPGAAQRAQDICGDNAECKFDYFLTGNENIAKATVTSAQEYAIILEQLKPGMSFIIS